MARAPEHVRFEPIVAPVRHDGRFEHRTVRRILVDERACGSIVQSQSVRVPSNVIYRAVLPGWPRGSPSFSSLEAVCQWVSQAEAWRQRAPLLARLRSLVTAWFSGGRGKPESSAEVAADGDGGAAASGTGKPTVGIAAGQPAAVETADTGRVCQSRIESTDWTARSQAVAELGRTGDPRAVELLLDSLDRPCQRYLGHDLDEYEDMDSGEVSALTAWPGEIEPRLIEALRDPRARARDGAALALVRRGACGAIDPLIEYYAQRQAWPAWSSLKSAAVAETARFIAQRGGPHGQEFLAGQVGATVDRDALAALAATDWEPSTLAQRFWRALSTDDRPALLELGPSLLDLLAERPSLQTAERACLAGVVGKLAGTGVVPALLDLLDQGREPLDVRKQVVQALLRHRGQAVAALAERMVGPRSGLALHAHAMLEEMAGMARQNDWAPVAGASETAVERLRQSLAEGDVPVKLGAVAGLGLLGTPPAVLALRDAVSQRHEAVQLAAIRMLVRLRCKDAVAELAAVATAARAKLQTAAVEALGKLGGDAATQAILQAVEAAILPADPVATDVPPAIAAQMRRSLAAAAWKELLPVVAAALHRLGWQPRTERDQAIRAFLDNQWETLTQLGRAGAEFLVTALAWGEPQQRGTAARMLARIGDPGTIPALAEALDGATWIDEASGDAAAFAEALGAFRSPAALPALCRALRLSPETCAAAARAIGEIGDSRARAPLEAAANRANAEVRAAARQALAKLDG